MALSISSEYITSDRSDHLAMRIPGGWISSWQQGRLDFEDAVAALQLLEDDGDPTGATDLFAGVDGVPAILADCLAS